MNFKIIVVGCGSMANAWVKYALGREDAEIVGLVDIKPENAAAMAQRHQLTCPVFTQLDEALNATSANLMFDITLPEAHTAVTLTALSRGRHVMGEKPMAASMEAAVKMAEAAAAVGKNYSVMQNRRYLKNIRAYKELIRSGTIGKPGLICADFFIGAHFGGFRDLMDSPLILDMAIHTFDQARFIAGGDPVSVYCHEFNPEGSWYKGNASAVCIFEFSNGAVFSYRGSWCAEGASTSWESDWRVTGSHGTALWDGKNLPYAESLLPGQTEGFTRKTERVEAEASWNGREGHDGCLDEMFSALLEGRKAETDCTDNIKSMAMVFGAIESAKTGRKIVYNGKWWGQAI